MDSIFNHDLIPGAGKNKLTELQVRRPEFKLFFAVNSPVTL